MEKRTALPEERATLFHRVIFSSALLINGRLVNSLNFCYTLLTPLRKGMISTADMSARKFNPVFLNKRLVLMLMG